MIRSLVLLIASCIVTVPASAEIIYTFDLDTTPLMGQISGPFSLAFGLSDGSGLGDGNNYAILSNFYFGGGSPIGSPLTFGTAFGDLTTSVILSDASGTALFQQNIVVGTRLQLLLQLSDNPELGGSFDVFTFSILDNTGTPIPSLYGAPLDAFVVASLSPISIEVFGSDTSRSPAAGGPPLNLTAPSLSSLVPEPGSALLVASVVLPLAVARWRRRRSNFG